MEMEACEVNLLRADRSRPLWRGESATAEVRSAALEAALRTLVLHAFDSDPGCPKILFLLNQIR